MRLFTKYFLFGMLVLGLAFSVSGYFLLHYFMESSLAREAEFALMQYQYDKFTVQSAMLSYSDIFVVIDVGEELFPELLPPGGVGKIPCPQKADPFAARPELQHLRHTVPAGRPGIFGMDVQIRNIHAAYQPFLKGGSAAGYRVSAALP